MSEQIATAAELGVMIHHYLIAAIWADCPEGTHPRASNKARCAAERDCRFFLNLVGPGRVQRVREAHDAGYGTHPDCGPVSGEFAAMGHDLWLTRRGHGTGFWDRDALPKDLRTKLTELAHSMGEPEYDFRGGWLYLY